MYPILHKRPLNASVTLMEVEAPYIARKARAGQFIILRVNETGERIPLTIADHAADKGSITIMYQKVGKTTLLLDTLQVGDAILDVVGPLGRATELEGCRKVAVCLLYTSDIIADCAGVQRSTVSRLVRKHQKDLEEFGFVGFEIRANETVRGIREEKLWHFNEQQATLFITYLQNTEAVRAFKKNLVREFFAMRKELEKRKEIRTEGKPIRRSLTDALRDSGEDERMHGHSYGT